MPRYALKIEYNGAAYSGWQRQKDVPSVQGRIEEALKGVTGVKAEVTGAGRTDTGVHALGQVAHVDLDKEFTGFRLSEALNYHLKPDAIAIVGGAQVADEFHARFDATERQYLFRLISRRAPAILDRGWAWQVTHPLDLDAMKEGARHLIGNHDFTTFRSVHCQSNSPVKTLDAIDITRKERGPHEVEFQFRLRARSFLHNQVRSIVGSLERVGAGSWSPDDLRDALEAKDRSRCGPVTPPHGLFLTRVIYPNDPFQS